MANKYELMSLGFVFDKELENVLLIEKSKPDWQKGKLNGVGGHSEPNELFSASIKRECLEETGINIPEKDWTPLVEMMNDYGDRWFVAVFCTRVELNLLQKAMSENDQRDEKLVIVPIKDLFLKNTIGNTKWLVFMAIDKLNNEYAFDRAEIIYF